MWFEPAAWFQPLCTFSPDQKPPPLRIVSCITSLVVTFPINTGEKALLACLFCKIPKAHVWDQEQDLRYVLFRVGQNTSPGCTNKLNSFMFTEHGMPALALLMADGFFTSSDPIYRHACCFQIGWWVKEKMPVSITSLLIKGTRTMIP